MIGVLNEYIALVWGDCEKITQKHFYDVGAKEKNRNPVIEALVTNYTVWYGIRFIALRGLQPPQERHIIRAPPVIFQ